MTNDLLNCTKCEQLLPQEKFPKAPRNTRRFGRGSWCNACSNKHSPSAKARRYRSNPDLYETLLTAQGGVCKICSLPPAEGKRLAVDHDHDSGLVRGLLCNSCNSGIGFLKDDVNLLKSAVAYLENPLEEAIPYIRGRGLVQRSTYKGVPLSLSTTAGS